MFHNFFLKHMGEPILFKTVSSAWICATKSCQRINKNRINAEDCKDILDSNEGLDYLIEYFNLGEYYDGEKIKNMFKYYLKKRLDT